MRTRFLLVVACGVAIAVGARAADEPESRKQLPDSRDVPVSGTNEVSASASAVAATSAAESNETKSVEQDEINSLIDKAHKRIDSGRVREAIDIFNGILKQDPVNKAARYGLGRAYVEMQRHKEALAVLEPMAEEFPKDYLIKNNIAWLYATVKDPSIRNGAKAIQFAQDALLIAPKDFHVWSTLSEAYYISGKYDKALRASEEALNLCLDSPAEAGSVEEYRRQVDKDRNAVQAMSVLK
jgi:tetratricopeptide (TPR) repeat protein